MSLDCHKKIELASYIAPLSHATDITTKLSPNKYCRLIDNRRTKKNAIPRYWSPSCLTTSSLSRNKLSMSDCSRMTIAILVPMILWCTLGLKLWHPNEVSVESVNWLRVRNENIMSGQVTVKYISRPTSRLYLNGSFNNSPSSSVSFRYYSIGNLFGRALVSLVSCKISRTYFLCDM